MKPEPKENLNWLIDTTDATKWAEEFMKIFGERREDIDEGLMLSWFANALETGRRAGQGRSSMNRYEVETLTDVKIVEADDWHQDGDVICFFTLGEHGKKKPVRWFNRLAWTSIDIVAEIKMPTVDYDEPVPIPKLAPPVNGVEFEDATTVMMPAVIP